MCGLTTSTINFASVPDAIDTNLADGGVDLVDDAIIAHTNSPIVVVRGELPAPGGRGFLDNA